MDQDLRPPGSTSTVGKTQAAGSRTHGRAWLEAFPRALPPAIVAIALLVINRLTAATIAASFAMLLLGTGLLFPGVGRSIDHLARRIGAGSAGAIAYALSWIGWVLMILPAWLWSRLNRVPPLRTDQIRAASVWTALPPANVGDSESTVRTASGTWGLQAQHRQTRSGLVVPLTVLLVAIGAFLLGSNTNVLGRSGGVDYGLTRDPSLRPGAPPAHASGEPTRVYRGFKVDDYAHSDEPWAPLLFGELNEVPQRPDLILGAELGDFVGKYVNIRDGRRVSYSPSHTELTIWFFGGSTMFGIGQRDKFTIPSEFAKLAAMDGLSLKVENFGVSSYLNWQETEKFEQMLTVGEDLPDLVVFYDGVNESGTAAQRVAIGDTDPTAIRRPGISELERAQLRHNVGNADVAPYEDMVDLAARQYGRGVEIGRRLAASYGIPVAHFWQPHVDSKRPQPFDSELLRRLKVAPEQIATAGALYDQVRKRSGANPIDLSHAFDELKEPVLFDYAHTNELGARVVAEAMFKELRSQLHDLIKG